MSGMVLMLLFLWGMKKEDWKQVMEAYGSINLMELDENVNANYHEAIFLIKKDREYQISGTMNITNGSAMVRYWLNDEMIFEKTYDVGNGRLEEYSLRKQEGELRIELEASDDVEGSYDFLVKQRRRNITRWKDNYFTD